ncbi:hypothetical protein [Streptomyces pseudovenezuelae]|nr:hypothetical protein [Streptomyces pseudovenezuelae]
MTNERPDSDKTEPNEQTDDEPIPPISSDWAPEVGEYQISTT